MEVALGLIFDTFGGIGSEFVADSSSLLRRTQEIADQRRATDQEIADQRRQDETLTSYFEQMRVLLTDRRVLDTPQNTDPICMVIRAQTNTTLARLGPERKRLVVLFLYGAGLIYHDNRIVALAGVDLRGADLRDAYLSGADLSDATVTEEQLSECESLEDATMPNGQKYEEWLNNKEGNGKATDNYRG
jgi:uncharacterized protein YjbI with pentapeptide repeats